MGSLRSKLRCTFRLIEFGFQVAPENRVGCPNTPLIFLGRRKMNWNFKDLTAQQFGLWTVLRLGERREKTRSVSWLCRCACGRESTIQSSDLMSGKSTKCRWCGDHPLKEGQAIGNRVFKDYRVPAIRRGFSWELTREQFDFLICQSCHYCGSKPRRIVRKRHYGELVCNGVDRRDNMKGYFLPNAVPCCTTCNRAKSTMSESEFQEWIEKVYHHGKQTSRFCRRTKQDCKE